MKKQIEHVEKFHDSFGIKNNYQQQIILKIEKELSLTKVKTHIRMILDNWSQNKESKSIRVKIDVDPM